MKRAIWKAGLFAAGIILRLILFHDGGDNGETSNGEAKGGVETQHQESTRGESKKGSD